MAMVYKLLRVCFTADGHSLQFLQHEQAGLFHSGNGGEPFHEIPFVEMLYCSRAIAMNGTVWIFHLLVSGQSGIALVSFAFVIPFAQSALGMVAEIGRGLAGESHEYFINFELVNQVVHLDHLDETAQGGRGDSAFHAGRDIQ